MTELAPRNQRIDCLCQFRSAAAEGFSIADLSAAMGNIYTSVASAPLMSEANER
jgi:hypothetical protein